MEKLRGVGFFVFKYLLCPFLGIFGIVFLAFTILNKLSSKPVSSYSILGTSSIFSLVFWSPFFLIIILVKIMSILVQSERLKHLGERHLPEIRVSIKTLMEIRPYLLILYSSAFLIFLAMVIKSYQANTILTHLSLFGRLATISSYVVALVLFGISLVIYKPEERAVFFLDRFFRSIDLCRSDLGIRLKAKDFEEALKSYQKTFPLSSYSLKDLKQIVRRTQLAIDRGTREEITKIQRCVHSLSNSVKTRDRQLFDDTLIEMNQSLVDIEAGKSNIIQVSVSRKEILQKSFLKILAESAKEIIAILALILIYVILYLIGVRLPFPP
jgi:biopolymer transport protein ExbB/TolQ